MKTGNAENGPGVTRKNYLCVQALRAVAASLVVLNHSITMWLSWIMRRPDAPFWRNGGAGVDIFFAISGFVMAISLPSLGSGRPADKAGVFLWRRFTRIVPLYWGFTTLKLAILKLWPAAALNSVGTPWRILASYLFIPASNGKGEISPVLEVGWTLNFEFFFYLLFAMALVLDLAPLAFLAPCLTACAVLGFFRQQSWPDFTILTTSMVLEFLYGVILAHLVVRGKMPNRRWAMLLLIGGFVALMVLPKSFGQYRFLLWGLPAALVLMGAVALEEEWGHRLPKWLLDAGDASYALYLSHTLLLVALGNLMRRTHITGGPALAVAIVLAFAVGMPVSLLVHRLVEKPLMAFFKGRRKAAERATISPCTGNATLPSQSEALV